MHAATEAIEVDTASWEEWVGAARRAEAGRALAASRPRRKQPSAARKIAAARSSLLWMLAVSVAGFWLLH